MVPDSGRTPEESSTEQRASTVTDGGPTPGFDDAALYSVVRTAVKDALLDVIGTVLLVGVGLVLVTAGGQAVVQTPSLPGIAVGVWLAAIGIYLAATALELVPPIREWL